MVKLRVLTVYLRICYGILSVHIRMIGTENCRSVIAVNHAWNSGTGESAFFLNYGGHPRISCYICGGQYEGLGSVWAGMRISTNTGMLHLHAQSSKAHVIS